MPTEHSFVSSSRIARQQGRGRDDLLDSVWKPKFQSESLRTLKGIRSTSGNIKSGGTTGVESNLPLPDEREFPGP
jgi:hypothetical protein